MEVPYPELVHLTFDRVGQSHGAGQGIRRKPGGAAEAREVQRDHVIGAAEDLLNRTLPDGRLGSALAAVAAPRIEVVGRLPGRPASSGQQLMQPRHASAQMRLVAGLPGSRRTFSEPRGAVCHQMQSWY